MRVYGKTGLVFRNISERTSKCYGIIALVTDGKELGKRTSRGSPERVGLVAQ